MVMAGGTGGHIMPALAVARVLHRRGVRIVWMGTARGLEGALVRAAGFELELIHIRGLRPGDWWRKLLLPLYLSIAIGESLRLIHKHRPDALLGMGGFVSGPGGLAARLLGKPLVLHEQNAVAGLTNRWLARLTAHVLSGFPDVRGLRSHRWVGNPVRREIIAIVAPQQRLAARAAGLRILVLGGSQGATVFNRYLPALLGRCGWPSLEVRHQCGSAALNAVAARYHEAGVDCRVVSFIDDMAAAYSWADVVICRAGAMTIAEVCAAGAAAVLVPYPHAAGDHQVENAAYMVAAKAALMVRQAQFIQGDWLHLLEALWRRRERLVSMATAARSLAKPNAAADVAAACEEVMYA